MYLYKCSSLYWNAEALQHSISPRVYGQWKVLHSSERYSGVNSFEISLLECSYKMVSISMEWPEVILLNEEPRRCAQSNSTNGTFSQCIEIHKYQNVHRTHNLVINNISKMEFNLNLHETTTKCIVFFSHCLFRSLPVFPPLICEPNICIEYERNFCFPLNKKVY